MSRIGVRSSRLLNKLWFHVDVLLASEVVNMLFTRAALYLPHELLAWEKLFKPGQEIIRHITLFSPVKTIEIRPKYFELTLWHEEYWQQTLPKVIEVVRHVIDDPCAIVEVEPNTALSAPPWHESMLEALFGSHA